MPNSTRPKRLRRRVLESRPVSACIRAAERSLGPRGGDCLVVAMFHETLSAERFAAQLDVLLEGRQVVSGQMVVDAFAGQGELPANSLWITFDDAYGDFYDVAWPVLERRGLPVTQFIATGFVGSSPAAFWWDRLQSAFKHGRARSVEIPLAHGGTTVVSLSSRGKAWNRARAEIKQMSHTLAMESVDQIIERLDAPDGIVESRVMTWDEIRKLVGRGLEVGGHTREHPMLDQLTREAAAEEIAHGFEDLRANLDSVLPVFAYPSGQYTQGVMESVRRCGIDMAVTTVNGFNRVATVDPMQIRRVPIGPLANEAAVRLRLLMARHGGA
ncbi:Polysaccharide deacetylase [Planctomycetes bacterium Poly30]|uniref:Polysaccharide deacetylase n=1 Tax=Saltatorellus ferox TaxID=2528018 RepID=A0A518EMA4_9BACT|nr:Polysaccharide deacetylase [Planctomycetes bacterium Poly30]